MVNLSQKLQNIGPFTGYATANSNPSSLRDNYLYFKKNSEKKLNNILSKRPPFVFTVASSTHKVAKSTSLGFINNQKMAATICEHFVFT